MRQPTKAVEPLDWGPDPKMMQSWEDGLNFGNWDIDTGNWDFMGWDHKDVLKSKTWEKRK